MITNPALTKLETLQSLEQSVRQELDQARRGHNDNFASIGTGEEFAMGSFYSTKDLPSEARIITALESAAEFCTTVRRPWNIIKVPND